MKHSPRLHRLLLLGTSIAVIAAVVPSPAFAQDAKDSQDTKPADAQPKLDAPVVDGAPADARPAAADDHKDHAPPTAKVSPEAKAVLDKVDAAYANLKTLELAGSYSVDIRATGEKVKESRKFTATFSAPNRFRHAMENDVVLGSTGAKAYAYSEGSNVYSQGEAPKDRPEGAEVLPEPIPQLMEMQNPSLLLALVKSAAGYVSGTFTDIQRAPDVQLDGAALPALKMTLPNRMVVTMLFNPQTHLLRQVRADAKAVLEARGNPSVETATFTVDYTTVTPDAAVKDEQFAWAPPASARDLAELADAGAAPGDPGAAGDRPAMALEGKPAPDFTLPDMDGKNVALKDLRGNVVVLDFWATWCGPCRVSLPHLDKLYEETKDKGVAVYAVNLEEEKEAVAQFIQNTNLKTPVLLDADNSVGLGKYKATGIPQTVVIGKDGKVAKVFIGFGGEQSARALKDAVDKAMKG